MVADQDNCPEAVELVVREQPDVVFIEDGMFPEKDGLETSRQIMAQFPTSIVILPDCADTGYREKALAAGASGYYMRPPEIAPLLYETRQALQRFRERDR